MRTREAVEIPAALESAYRECIDIARSPLRELFCDVTLYAVGYPAAHRRHLCLLPQG